MIVALKTQGLQTLEPVAAYGGVAAQLGRFDYRCLGKADIDALHGTLSGSATRTLCERAWAVFGDVRFERLAGISNGRLYNLRAPKTYQRLRGPFDKTRPAQRPIGERRKPRPERRPGFIRVDTVHQGDLDSIKGLYHLNQVDEGTQFQCVEEFTKSRARRSNDNALAEPKNGAAVRKHFGYAHIPGRFAARVNDCAQNVLPPYLNFHRPCFFPTEAIDTNGRVRKRYRYAQMMTPLYCDPHVSSLIGALCGADRRKHTWEASQVRAAGCRLRPGASSSLRRSCTRRSPLPSDRTVSSARPWPAACMHKVDCARTLS